MIILSGAAYAIREMLLIAGPLFWWLHEV